MTFIRALSAHARAAVSLSRKLFLLRLRPRGVQRSFSPDEARELAEKLSGAFGDTVLADEIHAFAAEFRRIEAQMVGRIAGDVEDHALNYWMVLRSAGRQTEAPRAHAEIGVLFGGGLILALHALRRVGSSDWVIGVDPLEGYYGRRRDPNTHRRICRRTVVRNARRTGLFSDRLRLICRRSEDHAAIDEVGRFSLVSLWIDGDHSYAGVSRDWRNYSPLVGPGGYVLFDNYHDPSWPDTSRFVDGELRPNLCGWEVAVTLGRSILLRKLA